MPIPANGVITALVGLLRNFPTARWRAGRVVNLGRTFVAAMSARVWNPAIRPSWIGDLRASYAF